MTIGGASNVGIVDRVYHHELDSGWYNVMLKGNSNLRDERVVFSAYLVEGEDY